VIETVESKKKEKNYQNWGLKYIYYNVHCTYLAMYISDLKLFFFMMMFQKYSELCLLTSRPVRQETMQVEKGEGEGL
jgi:hypothetical protein